MAQDNKAVAKMDRPADDAASCATMTWNQEFVGNYPWASEACRTVVMVNGQKWARFEGKYQRSNPDGSFDTEFVSRSDKELGLVTLMPEPGQRVHFENEEVSFSDLDRGQVLSFYVPEDAIGFAIEPGVPREKLVKIVKTTDETRYAAETTETDDMDKPAEEPVLLAQADTRSDERATVLPSTAGPLPLFALGGLVSLFSGLGLTIRRRMSKHSS
jgi:hypothetical protein